MQSLILLAAQTGAGGGSPFGGMGFFIPLVLMFVVFWFLMIRPAQRQERERKALIASLRKNDKVVAAGGIIGTVASIKENEDEITLKVGENVRIAVLRSSIVKVMRADESASEQRQEPDKSNKKEPVD